MNANEHWQSRPEGGGHFAIWLIINITLYGGRWIGRACLYPITLYFYLRRTPERRASQQYLQRVFGRPASLFQVFHHIHFFAATIMDRVFFLARGEKPFEIETQGLEQLDQCLSEGKGLLILGSHQGSFEALRTIGARRSGMTLRVLLDKQKTPAMTELLEALAPEVGACVIDAAQDGVSAALAMYEVCRQGGVVAMLADRGRGNEVLRRTTFLGASAPFPISPWLMAHTLQVPVMLCFGLYMGGNRYRLVFEPFAERVQIPRHQREQALDTLIARYAQRVEHYIHVAPYNWFNFYDFWQQDAAAAEPSAAALGEHVGV